MSAGLTQTQLAGERFSKEYISQIERGKTRPTESTVSWLAEQLGVDPVFLASGVSTEERTKVEAQLEHAEALSASHRYDEAVEAFREAAPGARQTGSAGLELRALAGEAWALQELGQMREALDLLVAAGRSQSARSSPTSTVPTSSCASASAATSSRASRRRSRCSTPPSSSPSGPGFRWAHSVRTSCSGARGAIACFATTSRRGTTSSALSSLRRTSATAAPSRVPTRRRRSIAQRQGHYVLSRSYAQRAKELCQQLNDERSVGRLLLMLGGLTLLLGDEEHAVEHLKASYSRALDSDSPADAAQALEGIARVHLNRGEYDQADSLARDALELLQGREDYLHEVCPSQLVLGRALLERGRLDEAEECFRAADAAAEQMASISHRTEAWVALGDLAARRGDDRDAARLYRNAAEALQEIRF